LKKPKPPEVDAELLHYAQLGMSQTIEHLENRIGEIRERLGGLKNGVVKSRKCAVSGGVGVASSWAKFDTPEKRSAEMLRRRALTAKNKLRVKLAVAS
jgi:hypothetical protein